MAHCNTTLLKHFINEVNKFDNDMIVNLANEKDTKSYADLARKLKERGIETTTRNILSKVKRLRKAGYVIKKFREPKAFSDEEFANVWNAASSVSEVMEHFSISNTNAVRYAVELRKKGYKLKDLRTLDTDFEAFAHTWNTEGPKATVGKYKGVTDIRRAYDIAAIIRQHHPEIAINKAKDVSKKTSLSDERFIEIWNKSPMLQDFIDKTGIERSYAIKRAAHLRRRGNAIKAFPHRIAKEPNMPPIDKLEDMWQMIPSVNALAKILKIRPTSMNVALDRMRLNNPRLREPNEHISNQIESFIKAWNNADTMRSFIRATLINKDRAIAAANQLRKFGVTMKELS